MIIGMMTEIAVVGTEVTVLGIEREIGTVANKG